MGDRGQHRGRVPVSTRGTRRPRAPKKKLPGLSIPEFGLLLLVVGLILATIMNPLRIYYEGRSEIARMSEEIQAKQEEKERLTEELERYSSEAYRREQVRRRLGVIDQGETAFRIVDPEMDNAPVIATEQEGRAPGSWWELLWLSISEPPKEGPAPEPPPVTQDPAEEVQDSAEEAQDPADAAIPQPPPAP